MDMAPYLPPASGEVGAVYALLQVIADPKAAKAALDKMVEHQKAIENATEKQQKLIHDAHAEASKLNAEQAKAKGETDRAASKAEGDLRAAKQQMDFAERRRAEVEQRDLQLGEIAKALETRGERMTAHEAEVAAEKHKLEKREGDIDKKEAALTKREADLAAREKQLADDVAENQKWLAGLKPPRAR